MRSRQPAGFATSWLIGTQIGVIFRLTTQRLSRIVVTPSCVINRRNKSRGDHEQILQSARGVIDRRLRCDDAEPVDGFAAESGHLHAAADPRHRDHSLGFYPGGGRTEPALGLSATRHRWP